MPDSKLLLAAVKQDDDRMKDKRFQLKSFDMSDIKHTFPDTYAETIGYKRLIEAIGQIEAIRDFDEQHIQDYERISDMVDQVVRDLDLTPIDTGCTIASLVFPAYAADESESDTLTGIKYRIQKTTPCYSRSAFYAPATYAGMVFEFSVRHRFTSVENTNINSIFAKDKYDITGIQFFISAVPLDKGAYIKDWLPALNPERCFGSNGTRHILVVDPVQGKLEPPDKDRAICQAWNYYNQAIA